MCSAISFILLTTSGIDNSLCLGEWDGGLRPKHSMKSGDFYGVALDLKAENQGGFGPFYQTYKDKSEPETGKLYHAIYHGSIMWTQNGRVLQIYKANSVSKDSMKHLVALGTVSYDAETISLQIMDPPTLITMYRYHKL